MTIKPIYLVIGAAILGGGMLYAQSGKKEVKRVPLPPLPMLPNGGTRTEVATNAYTTTAPGPKTAQNTATQNPTNNPYQVNIKEVEMPTNVPKDTLSRSQKDELVLDWAESGGIKNAKSLSNFQKAFPNMIESEKETLYVYLRDYILTGKKANFLKNSKMWSAVNKINKKYKLEYK